MGSVVWRDRVSGYNAVSKARGYDPVAIFAPPEVIRYEKEEV